MKTFGKYLGVLVQIIGVLVLAIPFFMGNSSNASLLTGTILVILGFLLHIFLGRRFAPKE